MKVLTAFGGGCNIGQTDRPGPVCTRLCTRCPQGPFLATYPVTAGWCLLGLGCIVELPWFHCVELPWNGSTWNFPRHVFTLKFPASSKMSFRVISRRCKRDFTLRKNSSANFGREYRSQFHNSTKKLSHVKLTFESRSTGKYVNLFFYDIFKVFNLFHCK
jgi:hypothetical protein